MVVFRDNHIQSGIFLFINYLLYQEFIESGELDEFIFSVAPANIYKVEL